MIKKNPGFTLIELLVAMGVASLVFLLTSSVLITVISANSKSQKVEAFEQVKNNLGRELSGAVRWGENVSITGNDIEADDVRYHFESGRVYKNGEPITPAEVEVVDFRVSNNSADPKYSSLVITAELVHRHDVLAHDVIRVVVSQRKSEVSQ